MPLSEEEQRLLEQLEQALAAEDPKFASTLRGSRTRSHYRRLAYGGAAAFLVGIVMLMTGVILPQTVVSVAGFVLMLGGAYFGLTSWRRSTQPEPLQVVGSDRPPKPRGSAGATRAPRGAKAARRPERSSAGFMERLEERWRRRRESGF
ncbi:MAG: DUF3040 domain-containing protein [Actinomycetota bacterium]|nr:DUF3040 domain-containing protein [Actinomycetota bacterium]